MGRVKHVQLHRNGICLEAVFEGLDFASLHKIRPPLSVKAGQVCCLEQSLFRDRDLRKHKVSGSTDLTYFDVPDCEQLDEKGISSLSAY